MSHIGRGERKSKMKQMRAYERVCSKFYIVCILTEPIWYSVTLELKIRHFEKKIES